LISSFETSTSSTGVINVFVRGVVIIVGNIDVIVFRVDFIVPDVDVITRITHDNAR
jgi:hypothetical protein